MKKAVVLLSGGLDSSTSLAWAHKKLYEVYALSFDYGQRHKKELAAARQIARHFNAAGHRIVRTGLGELGGSALTDRRIRVPQENGRWNGQDGVPATYVPARNIVFLSIAAAYAEIIGADTIIIGANAIDYSGYPDCRPDFLRAFERAVNRGTRRGAGGHRLRIIAPLLRLTKAQIVKLAVRLGVPHHLTWSCYLGGRRPCGRCDSCRIRAKGFARANQDDLSVPGQRHARGKPL